VGTFVACNWRATGQGEQGSIGVTRVLSQSQVSAADGRSPFPYAGGAVVIVAAQIREDDAVRGDRGM
jgi:hypothetical protein